jgi:hypothetical protein
MGRIKGKTNIANRVGIVEIIIRTNPSRNEKILDDV